MDNFEIIYCINLNERTNICNELTKMNVDISKVKQIDVIRNNICEEMGLYESHLKCLEHFESCNFKNCLILEDNFVFKKEKDETNDIISNFFQQNLSWDVLMLSGIEQQIYPSNIKGLNKVINVQKTSGYAVNLHFLPTLKSNYIEGYQLLKQTLDSNKYAIDQYWKNIQPYCNWYIFENKLGFEIDDCSGKNEDHNLFILGIITCKMNYNLAQRQYIKYLHNVDKYPITYVKVIGDENLDTPWLYSEKDNLLIIKCDDGYLNLPNKVFQFIKISKRIFKRFKGIFKTDDDIEININNLYKLLLKFQDIDYFGNYAGCEAIKTSYVMKKRYVTDKYKLFQNHLVDTEFGHFCSGGGYYLNEKSIDIIIENETYFKEFPKNDYEKYLYNNDYFKGLNIFEDKSIGVILTRNNILPNKPYFDENFYKLCVKWS